jgi:malate dehydrogenase
VDFFASPVEIGPNGIEKVIGLDKFNLSAYEKELINKAVPDLKTEITKGVKFIKEGI